MEKVKNYLEAVNWFGNHRVLCNNIPNIDPSVYTNERFDFEYDKEICQWFITDCNEREVEYFGEQV